MPRDGDAHTADGIELAVSDQSQFSALRDWMRGLPGVEVAVVAGTPGASELGVVDVLTVLAGSGGVVAAIRTLPDFIRSRRSGLRIETIIKGRSVVLDATNVEEVIPILERLLDD
ncbi:MAG: effector-associated constant component EACC1 [Pseudonocardiaceae bacterium]